VTGPAGGRGSRHADPRRGRLSAIALAGMLVCGAVGACVADQRYSYWVSNDSDHDVLLDVREQFHRTYHVPAHAYAPLFAGMGVPGAGWTLRLVDDDCAALQTFAIDGAHALIYVDPAGHGGMADDPPWSHGLRTAKSATLTERTPVCP
jgi:hypothetical protein